MGREGRERKEDEWGKGKKVGRRKKTEVAGRELLTAWLNPLLTKSCVCH